MQGGRAVNRTAAVNIVRANRIIGPDPGGSHERNQSEEEGK